MVTSLDAFLERPDVARLARRLAERPGPHDRAGRPMRYAAIALVLRPYDDGEPELLMIKRAEVERDPWSGHIACPGGRMDPDDRDLEHTAIRETWEETGIDLSRDGRILGTLDDITPAHAGAAAARHSPVRRRRAAGRDDRRKSRSRRSVLGSAGGDSRDDGVGHGPRARFAAWASARWKCFGTASTWCGG